MKRDALISSTADGSEQDRAKITHILRDTIIHSTLDWQSEAELKAGVTEAKACLERDRSLYEFDHACRMALLQKMEAATTLSSADTLENRTALAQAELRYQKAQNKLFAWLDEATRH